MKTQTITVRVTPEQRSELLGIAAARGVTVTALLLDVLGETACAEDRAMHAACVCPPADELLAVHDRLTQAVMTWSAAAASFSRAGDAGRAAAAEDAEEEARRDADRVARMVRLARAAAEVLR